MAQQLIVVGVTSGTVGAAIINENFTELYNAIQQPLKFPGQSVTFQTVIPANTKVKTCDVVLVSGAGTVSVGLTPNGIDFTPNGPISPDANALELDMDQYFAQATTLYITITDGATYSFRFNAILNFF